MTTQDLGIAVLKNDAFHLLLDAEVSRAAHEGYPYAVLVCGPRRLPGEDVSDMVRLAADVAVEMLRDGDIVGLLGDDVIVLGLPDTTPNGARVLAYRLKSELGMRSHHLRNTKWEAGYACEPEDGSAAEALVQKAMESAHLRRVAVGA